MKSIFRASLAVLLIAGLAAGCKKKDPEPTGPGTVKLQFSNIVGQQALELDTKWYRNAHNDSFQVTTYKYYISNVSLVDDAGAEVKIPESYYLINQDSVSSRTVTLSNIPAGKYTKLRFLIGVDSARNVSGAQTGALAQENDMFWTWNTGYIMAKLEGISPQSTAPGNILMFHAGGFAGKFNAVRTVELNITGGATVNAEKTPNVHIFNDVLQWFQSPNTIDFATTNMMMTPTATTTQIADNYADMFTVDHVD